MKASASAPATTRFPNYLQMRSRVPMWAWHAARAGAIAAAIALIVLLLAAPRTGLIVRVAAPMSALNSEVFGLAFEPSGATLGSSGYDGQVRLWDVASQRQIGPSLPGPVEANTYIRMLPGGRRLVAAYADSAHRRWSATVWDVDPASWKARACAIAGRSLTRGEWRTFAPYRAYRDVCAG